MSPVESILLLAADGSSIPVLPECRPEGCACVCNARFRAAFSARGFEITVAVPDALGPAEELEIFHVQNIRFFHHHAPCGSVHSSRRFLQPLEKIHYYGNSEDSPLPLLALINRSRHCAFVAGALNQAVFFTEFQVESLDSGRRAGLRIFPRLRSIPSIPPGEIRMEPLYLEFFSSFALNHLFDGYACALRRRLPSVADCSVLRNELIWGSWNMKIGMNINEALILRNAAYAKKHFPRVKWIQIDEGYSINRCRGEMALADDPDSLVDPEKFPHGMRYMADAIRDMGLKPAIWFSLNMRADAPFVSERPDCILKDDEGRLYIPGKNDWRWFDPSHPEFPGYLEKILDLVFRRWGYEALKLDFYSYPFFATRAAYCKSGRSPLELLDSFFRTIRRALPPSGYYQLGSTTTNVNLLFAPHVDNARYSADIDVVEKSHENFLGIIDKGVLALWVNRAGTLLFNSDAAGCFPYPGETAEKSWALWCYLTGTMLEIGGDMPAADQRRLLDLKKLFDHPVNGSDCELVSLSWLEGKEAPLLIFNRTHSLFGAFNWHPFLSCRGSIALRELQAGAVAAADFFTGRAIPVHDGICEFSLEPMQSVCWNIIHDNKEETI